MRGAIPKARVAQIKKWGLPAFTINQFQRVKSMENEAIVATDLTKYFGEGETRMTAVNAVGFTAHFGEMLFIVGPSGSGKTTLLSMISGILRPNTGKVVVKGDDIWTQNNDQLADFRLNTIGFVFQDYHLFPRLTTAENVAIPLILKQQNWNESVTKPKNIWRSLVSKTRERFYQ